VGFNDRYLVKPSWFQATFKKLMELTSGEVLTGEVSNNYN